ncbi:MAG: tRNA dihydrouridine synthase DusB [Oscillospiraceae bacterium]|jgi:nifR3 family TIM-barrel protein|nr:tRNA dihydrouridine synthase DusB [Oscillospiraceae bacterium]
MRLGALELPKTAALAPMAGVADRAFREICREMGACYVVGEMASSKGMLHQNSRTKELLMAGERERPCAVQLFGDDPAAMARAVAIAEEYLPDAIDINMGCPAPKVAGGGSGCSLMKNPRLAGEIIRAARAATRLPVTVKIRTGQDAQNRNAVEIALIAEENGADAVTVHGRTRSQMYAPPVDYETVAAVKRAVSIPVIGNGDVACIESAERMYETGCDLVMVGRGAQGSPWVFRELDSWFRRGKRLPPPEPEERIGVMLRQIALSVKYKGEYIAMKEARKHVAWYFHGFAGAAEYRRRAGALSRYVELERLAGEIGGIYSR